MDTMKVRYEEAGKKYQTELERYKASVKELQDEAEKRGLTSIRVECAWCKKNIKPGVAIDGAISHGICKPCRVNFFGCEVHHIVQCAQCLSEVVK